MINLFFKHFAKLRSGCYFREIVISHGVNYEPKACQSQKEQQHIKRFKTYIDLKQFRLVGELEIQYISVSFQLQCGDICLHPNSVLIPIDNVQSTSFDSIPWVLINVILLHTSLVNEWQSRV